jgi:hypothetical protein
VYGFCGESQGYFHNLASGSAKVFLARLGMVANEKRVSIATEARPLFPIFYTVDLASLELILVTTSIQAESAHDF